MSWCLRVVSGRAGAVGLVGLVGEGRGSAASSPVSPCFSVRCCLPGMSLHLQLCMLVRPPACRWFTVWLCLRHMARSQTSSAKQVGGWVKGLHAARLASSSLAKAQRAPLPPAVAAASAAVAIAPTLPARLSCLCPPGLHTRRAAC